MSYDDLNRRSSRVIPVREGRVFLCPAGDDAFIDIGYCRIESDEPAAITVKHGLGGRRVVGYNDRLEVSWLQTSEVEMAALDALQSGEHDLKLVRTRGDDEGGGNEERLYSSYFLQVLPNLSQGKMKIILEKMISVSEMSERLSIDWPFAASRYGR